VRGTIVVRFAERILDFPAETLDRPRLTSAAGEDTDMAVYRLFRNKAFEPETIATMSSAYDDVCRELGLQDRDELQANAVAKKIIEFAQRGERDPVRLRQSVLQAFQR
jgi:hypothetical protein